MCGAQVFPGLEQLTHVVALNQYSADALVGVPQRLVDEAHQALQFAWASGLDYA